MHSHITGFPIATLVEKEVADYINSFALNDIEGLSAAFFVIERDNFPSVIELNKSEELGLNTVQASLYTDREWVAVSEEGGDLHMLQGNAEYALLTTKGARNLIFTTGEMKQLRALPESNRPAQLDRLAHRQAYRITKTR